VFSVPLIGFNNTLVACGGGSFFEKGHEKKSIDEDLVTDPVLHRGLISGYPAPGAAFVGERD
jgi:hypothetical protein